MAEQINIIVKDGIKNKLKRIANIKSLEEGISISYQDLLKKYIDNLIEQSGSLEIELKK